MNDAHHNPDGGEVLVDGVASWLMSQALDEASVSDIFEGCCVRMLGAGIPLKRGFISFRTLHPLFASVSLIWRRGEGVNTIDYMRRFLEDGSSGVDLPAAVIVAPVRTRSAAAA